MSIEGATSTLWGRRWRWSDTRWSLRQLRFLQVRLAASNSLISNWSRSSCEAILRILPVYGLMTSAVKDSQKTLRSLRTTTLKSNKYKLRPNHPFNSSWWSTRSPTKNSPHTATRLKLLSWQLLRHKTYFKMNTKSRLNNFSTKLVSLQPISKILSKEKMSGKCSNNKTRSPVTEQKTRIKILIPPILTHRFKNLIRFSLECIVIQLNSLIWKSKESPMRSKSC